MEQNKFLELEKVVNGFAYKVASEAFTRDNFEEAIQKNGLRDEGAPINILRVLCDFNDNELQITTGILLLGHMYELAAPQTQTIEGLADTDRMERMEVSADVSRKAVDYLHERFPEYSATERDCDWDESTGEVTQGYADIRLFREL